MTYYGQNAWSPAPLASGGWELLRQRWRRIFAPFWLRTASLAPPVVAGQDLKKKVCRCRE